MSGLVDWFMFSQCLINTKIYFRTWDQFVKHFKDYMPNDDIDKDPPDDPDRGQPDRNREGSRRDDDHHGGTPPTPPPDPPQQPQQPQQQPQEPPQEEIKPIDNIDNMEPLPKPKLKRHNNK